MNNILIYSDLHICQFSLKECISILEEIGGLANKYNVDTLINCGDTFDGLKPSSQEMDVFATFIRRLGNDKQHIILAADSHESTTQEESILNHYGILSDNVKIVKEFKDENHLYCGHFMIKESNKNYGAKYSKNDFKDYLYTFLGHCVSEDTEILTEEGWKKYNELKIGENIATLNINKNKIEYQALLTVHQYNYKDKLLNFKTRAIDALVTPNHNMVVSNKKFKKQSELKMAYQIDDDNILINVSNWDYPIKYSFEKKELAKLIGWIIGDGSLCKTKKGNIYGVRLHQKVGYKSRLIENLLKKLKINYTKQQKLCKNTLMNVFYMGVINKELLSVIKNLCPDKKLNRKLIELPKQQLQLLFEGLILSDGCHQKGNLNTFYQKDFDEILIFEELCLRLGKRFYTRFGSSGFKPNTVNYEVSVSNLLKARVSKTMEHIKNVNYEGIVWCPEVKNGTWIAKRGNKSFITGNSHSYQLIKPNIMHIGSARYVNFDEAQDKHKIVVLITDYGTQAEKVHFLKLQSPIKMIEFILKSNNDNNLEEKDPKNTPNEALQGTILSENTNKGKDTNNQNKLISQGENPSNPSQIEALCQQLDKLPGNTKVKVKIMDFKSFREFLPFVQKYTNKFEVFKYETDFNIVSDLTPQNAKKQITNFKESFTNWLKNQKIDSKIKEILEEEIK